MSVRPYYKRFPSDFVAGCAGLNAEQIGVYSILVDLMYARWRKLECRTDADRQALARTCGCTTRQFNRVLGELLAMPGKITMGGDGMLSNPRFDRVLAQEEKEQSRGEKGQNNSEITAEKSQKNPEKNSEKNPPTLFENNGLGSENPVSTRARARSIVHSPKKDCVKPGSAAGLTPTAEHMTESGFREWVTACRRTIPRGWIEAVALKRWLELPFTPTAHMVEAWHAYIDHNREQSKGAKFPQKTRYPENWFKARTHLQFLEQVESRHEAERNAAAAREARQRLTDQTVAQWGDLGQTIIAKIGMAAFAKSFTGTTITLLPDGTPEIDFHKNDTARSDADMRHWDILKTIFPKPAALTCDRQRTSDAAFAAKRKKPP